MGKKIIPILILLFFLLAIPITFFVVKQQKDIRDRAAPATTLTFSPVQKTVAVGDTFSLDVTMNTAQNSIVAATLVITYNPTNLQAITLTKSDDFPNIFNSADTSTPGTASIALGTASLSQKFQGTTTLATITFKALQPTSAPVTISFGASTFLSSLGEGHNNALYGTTPASVTVTGDSATQLNSIPTPTETMIITPTRGATPTTSQSNTLFLTITAPLAATTTTTDPPTFSGTSNAGNSITVTLNPGTTTGAVTAASDTHWTYTPDTTLGNGNYTLTVVSTNPVSGASKTVSSSFNLNSSDSVSATDTPTPEATLPVTASFDLTLFVVSIALLCFVGGMFVLIH